MRRIALAIAVVTAIALVPMATSAAPRSAGGASGPTSERLIRRTNPSRSRRPSGGEIAGFAWHKIVSPGAPSSAKSASGSPTTSSTGLLMKGYTLRGVGDNSRGVGRERRGQISTGARLPGGDCRNDGVRNVITDAQVDYLIDQFDNNIYPIESDAFSVAAGPRTARTRLLALTLFGAAGRLLRGRRRRHRRRSSTTSVTTTSTTRTTRNGFTYIAGFFSSRLNGFFDRNVMTIDAFDWLHRTGANPPNDPVPGDNWHERARPPVPVRGRLRARVPAPARVLRGRRRGTWRTRACRTRADAHRLRRPRAADHRPALRLAHPVLPGC